jgi:hypothetical protein
MRRSFSRSPALRFWVALNWIFSIVPVNGNEPLAL